jgi:hypothetical protein
MSTNINVTTATDADRDMYTKEERKFWDRETIYKKLQEPFDPGDIKWKPQTVDYKAGTALAVAHADPRAYIDRLNEVLGADGWSNEFAVTAYTAPKFIRGKKGWGAAPATEDKVVEGCKLVVVCRLKIEGLGEHSSLGEEDGADDNAATGAEAQAFKRAAMQFGLGRYLYDLPKITVPYDAKNGGFQSVPSLPDWAIPKTECEDCKDPIVGSVFNGTEYTANQLIANSLRKYQQKLCISCQRKKASVK